MRRRLIAALAGLAIATLLLYAVPRAFMISAMVREQEERNLDRTADLLADAIDYRLETGMAVEADTTSFFLRDTEQLTVRFTDGDEFTVGEVDRDGAITVERTLDDGTLLTLRLSNDQVESRVSAALLPVVAFGAVAFGFAVVLAMVMSRRLSSPFVELADHAEHLGLDDGSAAPRSGLQEADSLADALDRSRERIAELLSQEREFSSNASHQLRTPLAALRLRVEDLSLWPDTTAEMRDELSAALAEIDRLAATVSDLLELARSGGMGGWTEIALDEVVDGAIARWEGQFRDRGRRLVPSPVSDHPVVATSPRAVDLVLDVLFENALNHGTGIVDVTVQALDTHVAVRVADEGAMDPRVGKAAFGREVRSDASSGSGIGLALARTIAESAGSRLHLVSRDPTVFELAIPLAEVLLPDR